MKFLTKQNPKPWKHQIGALEYGYDMEAAGYFMDMGTGKSRVAIDEIINHGFKLTLILCPLSVVPVWPIEFKEFATAPIQILALTGDDTQACAKLLEEADYSKPTVIVVNYDRITPRRDKIGRKFSMIGEMLMQAAKEGAFDAIYCDESHRIKAAGSSVSRFVWKLGKYIPIRRALTGTPMADKPTDVFGQYRFLDDSIYGTNFGEFRKKYCKMNPNCPNHIVGYEADNMKEFKRKFHSLAFIVKASDVQDLPPVQHITRTCNLSAKAQLLYKKLEDEFIAWLDEQQTEMMVLPNVLTEMLRLHQITSGVATYTKEIAPTVYEKFDKEIDTSKRDLLLDIMKDLDRSEPVVVFYRYKHDLANIKWVCKKLGRSCGEQNGQKHQWVQFQKKAKFDTIAVNIRSGGAGINLTRARIHIFYSVGLSNADYKQALKRGHRPGQKNKVTYYHLVVPGTMDEKIKKLLENKGNIVKGLIKGYKKRV